MTALELDKRICERIAKDGLTERDLKESLPFPVSGKKSWIRKERFYNLC